MPLGLQSLKRFLALYRKSLPMQVKKEKALRNVSKGEQTRLATRMNRREKVRGEQSQVTRQRDGGDMHKGLEGAGRRQ